jgi:hypothetical protein
VIAKWCALVRVRGLTWVMAISDWKLSARPLPNMRAK